MNRGNRNNASGQPRSGANAGSSSGKSALMPARDGIGNKKNAGSSSRKNESSSRNNRNNGSNSGNNRNNGSSSRNNRNNGSSSQPKREDEDGNHVPGTNVVRIMRTVLPANAKINDDAKEAVQECVSEYISLITSEANERCVREHRKTLTPEDLLYAMAKLGFDEYIQPLTLYLNRYRESESERTTASGEPTVYRTVNYQNLSGPSAPPPPPPLQAPPPPPLSPPTHFNAQVAPLPPSIYFVNPADAMRGFQGFRIALPGSTVDVAGPSTSVAYVPGGSTSAYNHYNTTYPQSPSPRDDPSRQFFK